MKTVGIFRSTYWNITMAGSAGKHDIENDMESIETVRHFAKPLSFLMEKLKN